MCYGELNVEDKIVKGNLYLPIVMLCDACAFSFCVARWSYSQSWWNAAPQQQQKIEKKEMVEQCGTQITVKRGK